MDKKQILKIIVWALIIISLLSFWVSLRSEMYAIQYGVIALISWLLAMGVNYLMKRTG